MFRPYWLFSALLIFVGTDKASAAFVPVNGSTADGTVDVNGLPQDFTLTQLRAGVGGNDLRGLAFVYFFELPTLPSLDSLVSAQLRLTFIDVTRASIFTPPNFNADLFGLGTRSTATILGSDYYDGNASGSSDTLLVQVLVTPTTAPGTLNVTGSSFTDYVKSLYNPDGTPIAAYAVFRVNPDKDLPVGSGQYRGYEFTSADSSGNVPQLQLEVAAVPEPAGITQLSIGLAALAGVFAVRLRRRQAMTAT